MLPGMAGGHVVQFCSVPLIRVIVNNNFLKKHSAVFDSPAIPDVRFWIKHSALTQLKAARFAGVDFEVFDCILRVFTEIYINLCDMTAIYLFALNMQHKVAMHCGKKYLEEAGTMHTQDLFWMSLKPWDLVTMDSASCMAYYVWTSGKIRRWNKSRDLFLFYSFFFFLSFNL